MSGTLAVTLHATEFWKMRWLPKDGIHSPRGVAVFLPLNL